jgi:uncharacterized protein YqgC (DUF456 family)
MVFPQDLIIALVIVVGLIGSIIQIIPGALVVLGAILVWSILTGGAAAWWIFAGAVLVTVAGMILKYIIAGQHLKKSAVSNTSVLIGLVAGAVGFFVIPVLGLPLGFIGGVFVCEYIRDSRVETAWKSTVVALKATGITILVELGAALVATALWVIGLIIT